MFDSVNAMDWGGVSERLQDMSEADNKKGSLRSLHNAPSGNWPQTSPTNGAQTTIRLNAEFFMPLKLHNLLYPSTA
jgi:hypothetical protein